MWRSSSRCPKSIPRTEELTYRLIRVDELLMAEIEQMHLVFAVPVLWRSMDVTALWLFVCVFTGAFVR